MYKFYSRNVGINFLIIETPCTEFVIILLYIFHTNALLVTFKSLTRNIHIHMKNVKCLGHKNAFY